MNPNLQMKMELFEDEWKKNVTAEQWKELAQIPEFDRDVVEKIVGFTLPLDDEPKDRNVDDVLAGLSVEDKKIIESAIN